jgi:hypothetical protein
MAAFYLNLTMTVKLVPVSLLPEIEVLNANGAPEFEQKESDEERYDGDNHDNTSEDYASQSDNADDGVPVPVF